MVLSIGLVSGWNRCSLSITPSSWPPTSSRQQASAGSTSFGSQPTVLVTAESWWVERSPLWSSRSVDPTGSCVCVRGRLFLSWDRPQTAWILWLILVSLARRLSSRGSPVALAEWEACVPQGLTGLYRHGCFGLSGWLTEERREEVWRNCDDEKRQQQRNQL